MKLFEIACFTTLAASTSLLASAAQIDDSFSGSCKPGPVQSIDAGDRPNHTYVVATAKCTLSGKIGGAMARQGAVAEHGEITPTRIKTSGIHALTMDGGDMVFLRYDNSVVMQDGAFKSGKITYRVIGGTGKMEGLKGAGTCAWIGDGDSFSCKGSTSTDHQSYRTSASK
jgi:hypothetical protein